MPRGEGEPEWDYARWTPEPDISVVIATIPTNRHETVCEHLDVQSFDGDWEVLVVNDDRLDRCEARNVGLEAANADIVAFTDDDTEPPRDWLTSIFEAFQANSNLVCLEGSVTGGPRYTGEGRYVGCNIAVRREAAIAVGGWDSRFAGWREDTEFGWRMETEAEGECEYRDEVRMVHPSLPRTTFDRERESLLRTEYPDRWEQRLDDTLRKRLWRYGQVIGVVPYVNRLREGLTE